VGLLLTEIHRFANPKSIVDFLRKSKGLARISSCRFDLEIEKNRAIQKRKEVFRYTPFNDPFWRVF